MADEPTSQSNYIDDSLGQLRLLKSKLSDALTKLFIASLAGCAFVGTASSAGTGPMLRVLAIVLALLLTSVVLVLFRYFRARGRIITAAKEHNSQ
ncbi:MAG: hypothetical protein PXZ08_06180 [Actinomycetota bacterium]|nr:hypothetical protein [Actinomycetota bacterium]